jgi:glycerol kinase
VNLGTGGFVLVAEPQGETERDERFLRSIAASNVDSSTFVIEGTVNGAGAALRWAEERLGASEGYSAANMDEWLGEEPEPIVFLNCVGGLGSPIWSPAGCFDWENVWVDFSGQEVANPSWVSAMCAVAESILFLININLGCMRRMGCRVGRIRVSGGLSRSDIFLQRLASLTGCEVERAVEVEATLCGVARMASHWLAESTGGWPEPQSGQTIQPAELADTAQLRQRYDVFCDLIERAN